MSWVNLLERLDCFTPNAFIFGFIGNSRQGRNRTAGLGSNPAQALDSDSSAGWIRVLEQLDECLDGCLVRGLDQADPFRGSKFDQPFLAGKGLEKFTTCRFAQCGQYPAGGDASSNVRLWIVQYGGQCGKNLGALLLKPGFRALLDLVITLFACLGGGIEGSRHIGICILGNRDPRFLADGFSGASGSGLAGVRLVDAG